MFGGLTYNTRGYHANYVEFFRARKEGVVFPKVVFPKGRFPLSRNFTYVHGPKFSWLYVRKIRYRKCVDGLLLRKKLNYIQRRRYTSLDFLYTRKAS